MAIEEACGGGGTVAEQGSPRSKVKFLCSYGGKILPRPSDGNLKYVGGETRVVAVSRDISFSELMKKLRTLTEGEMVLKYQIIPDDLDALVSVKSNEDLKHMIEEHDRHDSVGIPKLRSFLFPPNPVILENQVAPSGPHHSIEQRYIEAVNGVLRSPVKLHPIIANRPTFSISASSSPRSNSPDGNYHEAVQPPPTPAEGCCGNSGYQSSRLLMHKVQSNPDICGHHYCPHAQHCHVYYQNQSPQYQQQPNPNPYFPCRPTGPGNERIFSFGYGAPSHGISQFHPSRHNSGGGGGYDDCRYGYRESSVPHSPRKQAFRL